MRNTCAHWLEAVLGGPTTFPVFPAEYQGQQPATDLTLEYSAAPLGGYMYSRQENEFDEDCLRIILPYMLRARSSDTLHHLPSRR